MLGILFVKESGAEIHNRPRYGGGWNNLVIGDHHPSIEPSVSLSGGDLLHRVPNARVLSWLPSYPLYHHPSPQQLGRISECHRDGASHRSDCQRAEYTLRPATLFSQLSQSLTGSKIQRDKGSHTLLYMRKTINDEVKGVKVLYEPYRRSPSLCISQ